MRIKEEFKIRQIGGENVIIMQGSHEADLTKVIAFNHSSEYLWKNLTGKDFSLEDAAALLQSRYGIDLTTAREDARAWIDSLVTCGIIHHP